MERIESMKTIMLSFHSLVPKAGSVSVGGAVGVLLSNALEHYTVFGADLSFLSAEALGVVFAGIGYLAYNLYVNNWAVNRIQQNMVKNDYQRDLH
jgi:hypothetical protein